MSEIWFFVGGVGFGMVASAALITWRSRRQPCDCSDCRDVLGRPSMTEPRVTVTWELSGDHWMDWKAYLVSGWYDDGTMLYQDAASPRGDDTTPNLTEVFAKGFLKWDGYFQFDFPQSLHFDGERDAKGALTEMVERIFALAREHMPAFDEELGA